MKHALKNSWSLLEKGRNYLTLIILLQLIFRQQRGKSRQPRREKAKQIKSDRPWWPSKNGPAHHIHPHRPVQPPVQSPLHLFHLSVLLRLFCFHWQHHHQFSLKKLINIQVRMCYGCGNAIRVPPAIPDPPHDYCLVSREFKSYHATDGTKKVTNDLQNCHYHLFRDCILRKHMAFNTEMMEVSEALWTWLDQEFHFFA